MAEAWVSLLFSERRLDCTPREQQQSLCEAQTLWQPLVQWSVPAAGTRNKSDSYLHHCSKKPLLNNANSITEPPCKSIHGPNVGDEQVLWVCGLPAHFGIKVQASWLQTPLFHDGLWRSLRVVVNVVKEDQQLVSMKEVAVLRQDIASG